jgi:hypothetical protein
MQTTESTPEALAHRVAKLEEQNQRLKKAGIAWMVAAAFIVMGQAQTNRTLEANEFVLKDETGKARAKLHMERGRDPSLSLYDETPRYCEIPTHPQNRVTRSSGFFMVITSVGWRKFGGYANHTMPE